MNSVDGNATNHPDTTTLMKVSIFLFLHQINLKYFFQLLKKIVKSQKIYLTLFLKLGSPPFLLPLPSNKTDFLFLFLHLFFLFQLCRAPTNAAVQTFAVNFLLENLLPQTDEDGRVNLIDEGLIYLFENYQFLFILNPLIL